MTTGMQSPEILLQDLNAALRELRGAARLLDDERLDAELLPAIRRLLLAEVLGNTWIMAIGGSQGAGKTTLLSTLYQLTGEDAQWLLPNEGRGEKLPVLVLEDAAHKKVQGAIRQVRDLNKNGRYQLVEDDVDVKTFQKAVSDPDPEVLLPVLKVPQRYFGRSNQAWLLLPGYEPQDRKNKAWQELMRQALVAAAGCVIVTDETRMANQQQVEIVKDMMSNELSGAQPLVVISKTEAARGKPERLQELRSTAQKVFGVPEGCVLCAGADDSGYVEEWLPLLKAAIEDFSLSGGGDRKAQLARLEEVLSRDLTRALNLIRNKSMLFFQQRDGSEGGPKEVLKNCLEAFDDARDALRSRYHDEVEQLLSEQFGPAWKSLQDRLIEDHEGIWNTITGIFGSVTENQQRIEADVNRAWCSAGSVLERHATAVARLTHQALGAPEDTLCLPAGAPLQQLGYVDADQQPIRWQRPDQEDQKNLQLIFSGGMATDGQANTGQATKGFKGAVELLPALTLEYARAASLMPALVGVNPDSLTLASNAERPDLIRHSVQQLGEGVELGQTVLRSIATVLAADVASDGDIDVIPALLGSAAASTAAEGTAAGGAAASGAAAIGGIGAAVVGVVAVGYLVHSAMQEVHRHNAQGRAIAQQLLINVKDYHQRHFMRHFDGLMNQVRLRLVQKMRERYRLDESLMEQDRLAKAVADSRALQRDLLDALGRSGRTVMLFNVEATG